MKYRIFISEDTQMGTEVDSEDVEAPNPHEAFEKSGLFEGEPCEWLDRIWKLRNRDQCPITIDFDMVTVVIQEAKE